MRDGIHSGSMACGGEGVGKCGRLAVELYCTRMFEIKPREKMAERALLVGAYIGAEKKSEAESLLDELIDLVATLGLPMVGHKLISHRENHARYLIGAGKAQEIADF